MNNTIIMNNINAVTMATAAVDLGNSNSSLTIKNSTFEDVNKEQGNYGGFIIGPGGSTRYMSAGDRKQNASIEVEGCTITNCYSHFIKVGHDNLSVKNITFNNGALEGTTTGGTHYYVGGHFIKHYGHKDLIIEDIVKEGGINEPFYGSGIESYSGTKITLNNVSKEYNENGDYCPVSIDPSGPSSNTAGGSLYMNNCSFTSLIVERTMLHITNSNFVDDITVKGTANSSEQQIIDNVELGKFKIQSDGHTFLIKNSELERLDSRSPNSGNMNEITVYDCDFGQRGRVVSADRVESSVYASKSKITILSSEFFSTGFRSKLFYVADTNSRIRALDCNYDSITIIDGDEHQRHSPHSSI